MMKFIGTGHPWFVNLIWFCISIILFLGLSFGVYYFWLNPQAGKSVFILDDPQVIGTTQLCSGDALRFSIDARVADAGTYRLSMSTWRISPLPATYAFSEGLDMVIAESREFPIEILWTVPDTFDNLATGKAEPWPPGEYSRDIDVTATDRNTESEPKQIRFSIKKDCPQ